MSIPVWTPIEVKMGPVAGIFSMRVKTEAAFPLCCLSNISCNFIPMQPHAYLMTLYNAASWWALLNWIHMWSLWIYACFLQICQYSFVTVWAILCENTTLLFGSQHGFKTKVTPSLMILALWRVNSHFFSTSYIQISYHQQQSWTRMPACEVFPVRMRRVHYITWLCRGLRKPFNVHYLWSRLLVEWGNIGFTGPLGNIGNCGIWGNIGDCSNIELLVN